MPLPLPPVDNDNLQFVVDKLAEHVSPDIAPAMAANAKLMFARCDGRLASPPAVLYGNGITAINRTGAGAYTLTHTQTVGGYAIGAVVVQGVTGAGATAQFNPATRTTSNISTFDPANVAADELFTVILIG